MPRDDVFTTPSQHPQTNATELDDLMTIGDVAALLKVTKSWVYEHTRDGVEGRLPALKLGKYLRFHRNDLRAYVDAKRRSRRSTGPSR
jgi:excisionase family DNA binding protein